MKSPNEVPLAVGMTFLTCRFWRSLNKGLQLLSDLVSLNIVNKAQIILSSKCSEKVSQQFDELMSKSQQIDVADESIIAEAGEKLIFLRESMKKPEDIVSECDTDAMLDYLTEAGLEQFAARKAAEEHKQKGIIESQRSEIAEKTKELADKEVILQKTLEQLRLREQAKKDETYKKLKEGYKDSCISYVKRKMAKLWYVYAGRIISCVILIFLLAYFSCKKEILSLLINLLIIVITRILDFISLDILKQTCSFIMSSKCRTNKKIFFIKEYYLHTPPPSRSIVQQEDIMGLLE